MRTVLFNAVPYAKEEVTLALESGVDGLIVTGDHVTAAAGLSRSSVLRAEDVVYVQLNSKEDELAAAEAMRAGRLVVLLSGWEIIPVENLLAFAQAQGISVHSAEKSVAGLALEVGSVEEAWLAAGVLEQGVSTLIVSPENIAHLKPIVTAMKLTNPPLDLQEAEIIEITPVGMGHRVCVDTLSVFTAGQGMLVGNSAAFTFLVNAETEHNEYVASRPFRINAGAVHAYAVMPDDKTTYLEELRAGSEVLIVSHTGETEVAVVGRVKIEKRPMLLIRARNGETEGAVFLQNAETIRMVKPGGVPVSVVNLAVGDRILCRLDSAGRHFGIRITEDIVEA